MRGTLPTEGAPDPFFLQVVSGESDSPVKCIGGECTSDGGVVPGDGREETPTIEQESVQYDSPLLPTAYQMDQPHEQPTEAVQPTASGDANLEPLSRIQRVWGNFGEYTLDPKWRQWALERLGVGDLDIRVDLFSEPWSSAADLYITREMDAFSFNWGRLQEGSPNILWANPPFRVLTKVARKISQEPCMFALCTP